jgi:hypothetical protein
VFASYRSASRSDVDLAVNAARARSRLVGNAAVRTHRGRAPHRRRLARAQRRHRAGDHARGRHAGQAVARIQAGAPIAAWDHYADLALELEWEQRIGHSLVQQLPTGVVACITPWNYPLHQVTGKVAPALLAGCTVVLKPSELAPSSAFLLAEAVAQAGLPLGVFNLVHGNGPEVGEALVKHPEVDMVSFTGSTRAGQRIAAVAGQDIKRLALELGGKSAAVVLPGADLATAVKATLGGCFLNSGQTCSATTRLLVPRDQAQQAAHLAAELAPSWRMGDPADPATRLGPLDLGGAAREGARMVHAAIAEGAQLVTRDGPAAAARLLLPAHGAGPGDAADGDRARGGVRPGAGADRLRQRRRGRGHRQRHRLRPGRHRVGRDAGRRPARGAAPARRPGGHQRRALQSASALRRLQALRHRPRERPLRHRGIPRAALPATASQPFRDAMNYQQIQTTLDGATAVITLNRPERMNALTKVLEAELRDAIEQAGRNPEIRAIVLTGAGRAFCAGMDMDELEVLPPEDIQAEQWMRPYDMNRRADYQTRYSYFPRRPSRSSAPSTARPPGLGLVMALYSDFRIASEQACSPPPSPSAG